MPYVALGPNEFDTPCYITSIMLFCLSIIIDFSRITFEVIISMFRECLKSLSPWFWISRNFLIEMGGGGQTTKSTCAKGGVSIKRTCAYERGGGQILANLERTY